MKEESERVNLTLREELSPRRVVKAIFYFLKSTESELKKWRKKKSKKKGKKNYPFDFFFFIK